MITGLSGETSLFTVAVIVATPAASAIFVVSTDKVIWFSFGSQFWWPEDAITVINNGEENDLKIRVWGTKGGIQWMHSKPNTLLLKIHGAPNQILRAGVDNSYLSDFALNHCRTPSGHPEGFIEAFANIYRNFAFAVRNYYLGEPQDLLYDFPSVHDGVRGMKFIDAVVNSSNNNSLWTKIN